MSPASPPLESRKLAFLSALFILLFFTLFSYTGLFTYFTFDDGTAVVANQQHFETPMWRNILNILTVFTTAYRPLATIFWRPLYAIFGFHLLPYRIVEHLLLTVNIGFVYVLSRRLEVTREAALLTTLIFCYNASMAEMYYDTCIVTDVLCFFFNALSLLAYLRGRLSGQPFSRGRIAAVSVFYLLALDSKELAVAIPGVLTIYELLYHRQDFRDKQKAKHVGGFLAAMFVAGAIFLKVKVADMGQNSAYHPHVTVAFVLKNIGLYMGQLLYRPDTSFTPLKGCLILAALLAAGALVRSRAAIFGVLFFVTALIPVAVIPHRGAYCAYIPYFGLALAAGGILAGARSRLSRPIRIRKFETRTAVALFVCTAALLAWGHMSQWTARNGYFEWSNPQVIGLMNSFQQNIPEFPPNARVLIAEDPWGGDWGPMFLVELMYHDKTVWVDRPKNMDRPPDLPSYDLVVTYKSPMVDLKPGRLFRIPMKWQIRGSAPDSGQFTFSSPAAHGAVSRIEFAPQAVRSRQTTKVTIPGLSNVAVNALYRIVSGAKSTRRLVKNWCTLDANGSCTVSAAPVGTLGAMVVDWIQPANERWIFTTGILTIVE